MNLFIMYSKIKSVIKSSPQQNDIPERPGGKSANINVRVNIQLVFHTIRKTVSR